MELNQILSLIIIAIGFIIIILLLIFHKRVREFFLQKILALALQVNRANGVCSMRPSDESMIDLLAFVSDCDLETKLKLTQAMLGHKVTFIIDTTSDSVAIRTATITGEDPTEMMRQDKSIG